MKHAIVICVLFLSGCATIGEIEGLGEVGEVLRAAESTRVVLGGKPGYNAAPALNRKMGEARQLKDKHSIPSIIQSIDYIFE